MTHSVREDCNDTHSRHIQRFVCKGSTQRGQTVTMPWTASYCAMTLFNSLSWRRTCTRPPSCGRDMPCRSAAMGNPREFGSSSKCLTEPDFSASPDTSPGYRQSQAFPQVRVVVELPAASRRRSLALATSARSSSHSGSPVRAVPYA